MVKMHFTENKIGSLKAVFIVLSSTTFNFLSWTTKEAIKYLCKFG